MPVKFSPIERAGLWAILLLAAILRLWQLEAYPAYLHHDHSLIGKYALELTWDGLWTRWYSIGGWWLVPTQMLLYLFGPHTWVLRLTAVLSGILVVWVVHRLGRRFGVVAGLAAATLAAVSHGQVVFSRLPYAYDSVGPFMLAFYWVLLGWQTRRPVWWMSGGAITGYALWSYWGSFFWLPMYLGMGLVAAACRPRDVWHSRQMIGLWCIGCLMTGPLLWTVSGQSSWDRVLEYALQIRSWGWSQWLYQVQHAIGTLVIYPDSGGWGRWTEAPVLLWPEILFLGILVFQLPRRGRMLLLLSVTAICVVVSGNILIADPANFYHLLPAFPFLSLLAGVGVSRLQRPGAAFAVAVAVLAHLSVLSASWGNLEALSAPMVAVRWLADHRDLPCVTIIRPRDENPAMYAFVDRIKLDDTARKKCPGLIVFPGLTAPRRDGGRWQRLPSAQGSLRIWTQS